MAEHEDRQLVDMLKTMAYRFNGKSYATAEEFRAAMLEAARARPELYPEGRPVTDFVDDCLHRLDERLEARPYDPKAVKAFEDRVRDNQGREP